MTKDEEAALLGTVENLMKFAGRLERGIQLVTNALVQMENRLNVVEEANAARPKLMLPSNRPLN